MVAGRGSVWVANYGSSTVARVDPATNKVTGRVSVGASPCGIAVGGGAVWVDGYGTNVIEKVDMRRLRVVKRIHVGNQPYDVAYAFGAVWSSDNGSGAVSRIDPRRGKVVKHVAAPFASGFAVARGYLWVGATQGTKLFRIDPRTNAVRAVDVGIAAPAWLAASDDGVWAAAQSGKVVRVDPATSAVVARLDAGAGASDGSVAPDGSVWIPLRQANAVVRIDPATNAVAERIPVGAGPFVANLAFGDLWVGRLRRRRRLAAPDRLARQLAEALDADVPAGETTPTRPAASTLPARRAATAAAPLGSTTSFSRSNANPSPRRARRRSRSRLVARLRTTANVSAPGIVACSPSAIVRGTSIAIRSRASSERRVSSPASGSTPTTRVCGGVRLAAVAQPATRPPPPTGTTSTSSGPASSSSSSAAVPWPAITSRSSYGGRASARARRPAPRRAPRGPV